MEKKSFGFTSFTLHIMAMFFMLLDHTYVTIAYESVWLNCIGRLAFPIFAFMIVEGWHHTKDYKKYIKRMFIFAIISEIPFNAMAGWSFIYPFHQNVLWTFLISLLCIILIEKYRKNTDNMALKVTMCCLITVMGYIVGVITFVDYQGAGVLTVLLFYFTRGNERFKKLFQLLGLIYINFFMLAGFAIPVTVGSDTLYMSRQWLAVLAIIPIWLYNGKQGIHNKAVKYSFYVFYPLHIIILLIIQYYKMISGI